MFTRKLLAAGSAGALAVISLAGASTAQAAGKTAIDKGGAFCFQFGYPAPGGTASSLALDIDPSDHPTKQRLWWVSGVEKGTNADVLLDNYVNNLNGTATLAKPNNNAAGPKLIHMALTGTSFGTDTDAAVTGLWELDYNLQLNRTTLKGTIVGLSTFTPVAADGTPGAATTYAVNTAVKPVNCKKL